MKICGELFSQQFIPGLIDGTKKRTSRPIKPQPETMNLSFAKNRDDIDQPKVAVYERMMIDRIGKNLMRDRKPKYQVGDIFYVRETWTQIPSADKRGRISLSYIYKADNPSINIFNPENGDRWHPSIHMPREAARLWFKVTDVKAQRLDELTEQDAIEDGFKRTNRATALALFRGFWIDTYGEDKPWMWVYYFEPCTNPDKEIEHD